MNKDNLIYFWLMTMGITIIIIGFYIPKWTYEEPMVWLFVPFCIILGGGFFAGGLYNILSEV